MAHSNIANQERLKHRWEAGDEKMRLELADKCVYEGIAFGANRSVAGELVFQTGMVGYPEAITDPSYRGQILVITFPLVGNYGVPSRKAFDNVFNGIPAHFEANKIHVSGLIVASYSGEDYSHHLAVSSLGTWLKEQGVPAMHGVDTRALTKRIREEGSMLGKMLIEIKRHDLVNGCAPDIPDAPTTHSTFESMAWRDPNRENLVMDGEKVLNVNQPRGQTLTWNFSVCSAASILFSAQKGGFDASIWTSGEGSLC